MNPSDYPNCTVYYVLRIIQDNKFFNDPDTRKPLPIMIHHLKHYKNICPNAEEYYQRHFANNEVNQNKLLRVEDVKKTIKDYYEKFISPKSRMPKLPNWGTNPKLNMDLPTINLNNSNLKLNLPNLNLKFPNNKSRKNRKTRKNRKARKTRKN